MERNRTSERNGATLPECPSLVHLMNLMNPRALHSRLKALHRILTSGDCLSFPSLHIHTFHSLRWFRIISRGSQSGVSVSEPLCLSLVPLTSTLSLCVRRWAELGIVIGYVLRPSSESYLISLLDPFTRRCGPSTFFSRLDINIDWQRKKAVFVGYPESHIPSEPRSDLWTSIYVLYISLFCHLSILLASTVNASYGHMAEVRHYRNTFL